MLRDADNGTLQPLYNHMDDLPDIGQVAVPFLPAKTVERTAGALASFDAGRGCPFQCSFCTIINVQGRKSRYRSVEDIARIVRANVAQGIYRFFITDDNLARNRNWEAIFDRLIELSEGEGLNIRHVIQVDTLCHRIANFIAKAARAGVVRVFIGLENINPESLVGAKKRQNKITEYREMLQAWKAAGVVTYAGYILGFPTDTAETIVRDIKIIQRELPLDLLEFFFLTPLPGSEDHKNLYEHGIAMDPDLNKYDLNHYTTGHALMSKAECERAYALAWKTYYTPEHIQTVMKRARARGISVGRILFLMLWFYDCITLEKIHPLEGGFLRRKVRRDRRHGMARENALAFYPKYWWELADKHARIFGLWWTYRRFRRAIKADPAMRDYTDLSLEPVTDDELDVLEMFTATEAAQAAVARTKAHQAIAERLAS